MICGNNLHNPAKNRDIKLTIKNPIVKIILYYLGSQYKKIFCKTLDKRLQVLYICNVVKHIFNHQNKVL